MCRDNGVVPVQYQSDNGSAFTLSGFTAKLKEFAQIICFAGTGAHHHNGTAERAILVHGMHDDASQCYPLA